MDLRQTAQSLSRIDKLNLDWGEALTPEQLRRRRADRGFRVAVGDDAATSYGLQLALLTSVNLATRMFADACYVHMSPSLADSRNIVGVAVGRTVGEAVTELGGRISSASTFPTDQPYLVLGDIPALGCAIRATYDGWQVAVGPAAELAPDKERDWCPLAGIATAALGLGELFAEFAGVSLQATRRVITYSLWRPGAPAPSAERFGEPCFELPAALSVFGLGHLGQAYLWAFAAMPLPSPPECRLLLCDDDSVEAANLETGAMATGDWLNKLKTRMAAEWLERRGFTTRLLERRIDENFRWVEGDPAIALSGFDDNGARQWLSGAGFNAMFDSGLGGEASNFDAISFRLSPNSKPVTELWRVDSPEQAAARAARRKRLVQQGTYGDLAADDCGRLMLAEKAVAVPFVGAFSACIVMAELIKAINGGPVFEEIRVRLCTLEQSGVHASMPMKRPLIRGVSTQRLR